MPTEEDRTTVTRDLHTKLHADQSMVPEIFSRTVRHADRQSVRQTDAILRTPTGAE